MKSERYTLSDYRTQQVTVLVLLDFSKAFATVDFDFMIVTLASLNISPNVINWFRNYLQGRRQRIRITDSYSHRSAVRAGVPQGGVLLHFYFHFLLTIFPNISLLSTTSMLMIYEINAILKCLNYLRR